MTKDHSNPKYIKVEVLTLKVRTEPTIREIIKIEIDWATDEMVGAEDNIEVIDPNFNKATEGTIFKETLGDMEDKTVEENTEIIGVMSYKRSRDISREGLFSRNYGNNRDRSSSSSRLRSGSRASTKRDRIRCYNCREYDHFARDCPTSREERDLESNYSRC